MRIMQRRRKPDLLAVLAFIVGLGVIVSSLAQGVLNSPDTKAQPISHAPQAQQLNARR